MQLPSKQIAQDGATNGQVLIWNSVNGRWEPGTFQPSQLGQAGATNLQALVWNSTSSQWEPATILPSQLAQAGATNLQALIWNGVSSQWEPATVLPSQLAQEAAADGQALAWSAAASKWQPTTISGGASGLSTNYLDGISIGLNSINPNYQIDLGVGCCRSDDDTADIVIASPLTIDLTVSGKNGLDTGSEAISTWYYEWAMLNPTTTEVAGIFSASSSSPSLPAGFTKKRRIGSWFNGTAGDLLKARCHNTGRERLYMYSDEDENTVQILSAGSAIAWTDLYCSYMMPPTSLRGIFVFRFTASYYDQKCFVRPGDSSQNSPVNTVYAGTSGGGGELGTSSLAFEMMTSSSQRIQYRHSSSGNQLSAWVMGYIDHI